MAHEDPTPKLFDDYDSAKAHHINMGGFLLVQGDQYLVVDGDDVHQYRSSAQVDYLDSGCDWDETFARNRLGYMSLPTLGEVSLDPELEFHGPVATHRMPCAVYGDQKAVYNCNTGVFKPSWSAQAKGWQLVRVNRRWLWLLKLLDRSGNVR